MWVCCDLCSQDLPDAGNWSCKQCKFDVCHACGIKRDYKQYLYKISDSEGRSITGSTTEGELCRMCRKYDTTIYKASGRTDGLCRICVEKFIVAAPAHPIVRCTQNHLLLWTARSRFSCSSCTALYDSALYSCSQCKYCLCFSCVDGLIQTVLT